MSTVHEVKHEPVNFESATQRHSAKKREAERRIRYKLRRVARTEKERVDERERINCLPSHVLRGVYITAQLHTRRHPAKNFFLSRRDLRE